MKKILLSLFILLNLTSCYKYSEFKERSEQIDCTICEIDTFMSNVFLIKSKNENKYILIDSGSEDYQKEILANIKKYNVSIKDISLIILTHGHGDHSGGVKYFKDNYKTPVLVGKGDKEMVLKGKDDELKPTTFLASVLKAFLIKENFPSFIPDIVIDNDYDLSSYGINGKVVYMPGHTEGSLAVIIDDKAFIGDMIRGDLIIKDSPQRHFFHNNEKEVNKNLKNLIKKGIKTFYLGHFGPLRSEDVKKYLNEQ